MPGLMNHFLLHHVDGWVHAHRLLGEDLAAACTVGRRQAWDMQRFLISVQ